MADYISRDFAVENMENYPWDTEHDKNAAIHLVRELVPAADVVLRSGYDRILAENDAMRDQLAEIGKKQGDSMEDVRPVDGTDFVNPHDEEVYGLWWQCNKCGNSYLFDDFKYCPYCGRKVESVEEYREGNT